MKQSLVIVKVGGAVVEQPDTLKKLLADFVQIPGYKILVHGGGRSATALCSKLGIESRMVDGRRITDAETLKVVTMVYGGLVNKNIVAGLQASGVNAIGLTGADSDVIRAEKRPVGDIDYGYVGDVVSVNAAFLSNLLESGVVPVLAPLTHDGQGQMLNYVLHLDPWWNPAIEQQATDRAYRIGQDRNVTVYHLISARTIEEKMLRLHKVKRDMADSLLAGTDVSGAITLEELRELVKRP